VSKAVPALLLAVLSACSPEIAGTTSTNEAVERSTTTAESSTTSTTSLATSTSSQVLVLGDWGSGTSSQRSIADAMARHAATHEIDAILTTGDNFYSDDADLLMEPLGWAVEGDIPFWITWGNHDRETNTRIDAVDDSFGSPPRWAVFEWGTVDVIVLDSNQVDSDDQREFLMDALADTDDPTIVVFHHPALSCGSYRDSQPILDQWVPLFDDDVFLVLSGHDHNYQRFEHDGVIYVVSGGGGQSLYEIGECDVDHPELLGGKTVHHFLVLDQTDGVTVTALDVNGNVIDEVDLALP